MQVLAGQSVFITGATAGIGEACARAFASFGCRLILCGRRSERLEALAAELTREHEARVHTFSLDVRDAEAVAASVAAIPEGFRPIDILVNNAGLSRGLDKLQEGRLDDWDEMLDTNVKGLLYVTRAVVPGMVEQGRGHVINLGSVAGREVYPKGNVYCASKHAVDAITKGLRLDLNGTGIRVSTVDPGLVNTEFGTVRYRGDEERAQAAYAGLTPLTGDDIAEAVVWVASRPERVLIAEVLLFPTDQASSTVAHRSV